MVTFLKAQAASLTASVIDFLITILCVQILGIWYVLGSAIGTVIGGLTNFSMGRKWVFNSTIDSIKSQIARYIIVWISYLLIITYGVYILTHYTDTNYVLSKIIMSSLVGIPYNYFFQKKFIFLSRATS